MPIGKRGVVERHRVELVTAFVLLALPWGLKSIGFLDENTVWLVDAFTATLFVAVAILKEAFADTAEQLLLMAEEGANRLKPIKNAGNMILEVLADTDGERYEHALMVLEETTQELRDIQNGILPLRTRDYYNRIESAINAAAPHTEVWAVSTADPFHWQDDDFQRHWLELNKNAVKQRNVEIERVFIFEPSRLRSSVADKIQAVIQEQVNSNIRVHLVDPNAIAHLGPQIKKAFVLFRGTKRLFRDYADEAYPGRVLRGELVINDRLVKGGEADFTALRACAFRSVPVPANVSVRGRPS